MVFFQIILLTVFFLFTDTKTAETGRLTIQLKNIKNNQGFIKLSLFNSKEGFPSKNEKAYRKISVPIKDNAAIVTFEKLPLGEYAVILLHDENNNNKMDYQFWGMPKEGFGASNDAKVKFGPPSYQDSVFKLDTNEKTIVINVRYM